MTANTSENAPKPVVRADAVKQLEIMESVARMLERVALGYSQTLDTKYLFRIKKAVGLLRQEASPRRKKG